MASDWFAQRRQERLRGAGTHAIVQRGLDFFTNLASPLRGSKRHQGSSGETSRLESDAGSPEASTSMVTPQRGFTRTGAVAIPASISSVLSAPASRDDYTIHDRPMPATSSPTRNIDPRLLYAGLPGQEDDSDPDEAASGTLQTPRAAGPLRSPIASHAEPLTPLLAQRRRERMRGAGTHAIAQRQANFAADDTSTSISQNQAASPEQAVDEDGFKRPTLAARQIVDYDERRRERMRGAGTHAIAARNVAFQPGSPESSSLILSDASASGIAPRHSSPSRDQSIRVDFEQRRLERMRGAGTHAIAQRQGLFPQARDSLDVTADTQEAETVADDLPIDIERRRQERMRGAGNHAVARRSVSFAIEPDSGISTDMSDAMASRVPRQSSPADVGDRRPYDFEQRQRERMRGAGKHAIQQRQVGFEPAQMDSSDALSPASTKTQSAEASTSFARAGVDNDLGAASDRLDESRAESANSRLSMVRKRAIEDVEDEDAYLEPVDDNFRHDFDLYDYEDPGAQATGNDTRTTAFRSAPTANRGRFDVQITGKRGRGRPRLAKTKYARRGERAHLVHQELADDTVVGDADITIQEQRRDVLVPRPMAPWTLSKAAVTPAERRAMKKELSGAVTLALGQAKAKRTRAVTLNDADVLWDVVKKVFAASTVKTSARWLQKHVEPAVLATFTHLSRQSAERAQLIAQLKEARKTKLAMRKAVFAKRRRVLAAKRAIDALVAAEQKRTQDAVATSSMLSFLNEVRATARENWV